MTKNDRNDKKRRERQWEQKKKKHSSSKPTSNHSDSIFNRQKSNRICPTKMRCCYTALAPASSLVPTDNCVCVCVYASVWARVSVELSFHDQFAFLFVLTAVKCPRKVYWIRSLFYLYRVECTGHKTIKCSPHHFAMTNFILDFRFLHSFSDALSLRLLHIVVVLVAFFTCCLIVCSFP